MNERLRLLDIINIIDKGKRIIDIGTDHGLVPLYLAKNKISDDILATDISEPSLNKLRSKLDKSTEAIIKTKVTDGFKGIEKKDRQVAIIAGMGANTIIDIIGGEMDFAKNLDYMVLASNINTRLLREFLVENGFSIELDFLSFDKGKFYDILKVENKKGRDLNFEEYYYGFTDIENKSAILKEKIQIDLKKNKEFLENIKKNSDDKEAIKRIEDRLEAIRKVEIRCR